MKKIILTFFILISFLSCQHNKNKENDKLENNIFLKYKRTVKLPLDSVTDAGAICYQHFIQEDKNYYAHLNEAVNSIYIYNFDKQKKEFIIPIHKDGVNKMQNIREFYIHNFDSIFISSVAHQAIFLINRKGIIINKYPYKNKDNSDIIDMKFHVSYYGATMIDKKLHCVASKSYSCILDIDNATWKFDKNIHKRFDEGVWIGNFYLDTYQVYNKHERKFYYSYSIVDYIYDNIKDENTKVYAGSKYFSENNIKPFPKGNTKIPFQQRVTKFLQTPSYTNFIYDPYRQMYYRIANIPMTDDDIKNTPKQNQRKKHSVIVLNKDRKKIGEIDLPKYEYGQDIMCTKEGLNIFNRKKTNKNEDAIYFDVFELVEKNR